MRIKQLEYFKSQLLIDIKFYSKDYFVYLDFTNGQLERMTFEKEEGLIRTTLKKALHHVMVELEPTLSDSSLVLKLNREIEGISVRALGKELGISRQLVLNYENGVYELPEVRKEAYAKALEFNIVEFNPEYWVLT